MFVLETHGVIIDREKAIGAFRVAVAEALAYKVPLVTLYYALAELAGEMAPDQIKGPKEAHGTNKSEE
jgi:hypothetical protein